MVPRSRVTIRRPCDTPYPKLRLSDRLRSVLTMTAPVYTPLAVVRAKTAVVTGGDGVVADRTPSGVTGLDSGVIPCSNVNSVPGRQSDTNVDSRLVVVPCG